MGLPKIFQMIKNRVSFAEAQTLTDAQKVQARTNIEAAKDSDVVKVVGQALTETQKARARSNIGVTATADAVTIADDQTITGRKTFSRSPEVGHLILSQEVSAYHNIYCDAADGTGQVYLSAGSEWRSSPFIRLFGANAGADGGLHGSAMLQGQKANSDNTYKKYQIGIYPYAPVNGRATLLYEAGEISSIEGVVSKGTNYIRFASGLQICWGFVTFPEVGKWRAASASSTFPVAFANENYRATLTASKDTSNTGQCRILAIEKTNTTIEPKMFNDSSDTVMAGVRYDYIAIGFWK